MIEVGSCADCARMTGKSGWWLAGLKCSLRLPSSSGITASKRTVPNAFQGNFFSSQGRLLSNTVMSSDAN